MMKYLLLLKDGKRIWYTGY